MKKLLRFLFSIGTTFSLVSCGSSLSSDEQDEGGGLNISDVETPVEEDTTPSDNNPSPDNPSSDDPSPNPGTETTKTVYRINFYNCGTHLGYLDLEEGTKVDKNTYTKIPSYPTTSNQYQYTFVGWTETRASNDIGSASTYTVNKNVNLHALYSRDLKKYSVTFYYGTTKLGSQDFDYGSVIGTNNAYGYSEKLTKSSTGTTYTFIGWNKERPDNDVGTASTYTITADLTLFAVFTSATNSYSVTFINEGATLGSQSFPSGSKIEKGNMYGYNLSKSSTSQYTYSFDGWHETSTSSSGATYVVTKNMTVHAIYTSTVREYTVTFKNNGNNVGNPITYTYGQKPSCSITPSRQGSGVTYTFVGWSENPNATATSSNVFANDNLPTVSKNTTYHAIFSSTTITYQITFKNGNTTLKGPTAVNYNTKPSAPNNPTKDEEKNDSTGIKYTYAFAGWSTNSNASAGANNVYASNNLPVATKDDTYYAIFSKTTYYLVTFYNGNTALTSDYYVESGKKPTYSGTQPSKQGSGVTYTFIGWNESSTATTGTLTANLPAVSKKTNYYAIFSSTTIEYSVTFMNNGTSLGSQSFPSGSKIKTDNMYGYNVSKSSTAQYTYTFAGWNESSTASSGVEYTVTKNMTVHAIYTSTTRQYSVTFMNGSTTLKGPTSVNYGVRPTAPSNPTKSGTGVTYTFVGWSENPSATATSSNVFTSGNLPTVSKDTTYYAIFSSTTITYQITFKNGNTTLKGPTAVNYNTKPSAPTNNPTKDEEKNNSTGIKYTYTFAGWSTNPNATAGANNVYASNNLPVATKDDTYYAIFSKTTYYLVTFYNGNTALTSDYYVESGKKPTYSGTQPSKSGNGVTYTFIGWNESSTATTGTLTANLPAVSKKTNYYAIFSSTSTGGGSGNPELTPEYATIVDVDKIELFVGTASPFGDTATYSVKDEYKNNYEITWSLDESGDEDFFKLETSDNNRTVTITVIEQSRFTYLHVKCVSQSACKIQKITLLSATTPGSFNNFSSAKVGETAINESNYYVYTSGSATSVFSKEDSTKYDYVIPSSLKGSSGDVKKVGLCKINYWKNLLWVRRLYIPETVFWIDYGFSLICVDEYMHFSSSELGFLLFDKNTLWNTQFVSDNLLTMSNLCILSGPEHYNFPYTKIGFSSNKTWNPGNVTYNDWNWQTNWADKYKANPNSDEINNLKNQFKNFVYFTN